MKQIDSEQAMQQNESAGNDQMNVDGGNDDCDNGDVIIMSDRNRLDPKDVDAYWLQGAIRKNFPLLEERAKGIADALLPILEISITKDIKYQYMESWEISKLLYSGKNVLMKHLQKILNLLLII